METVAAQDSFDSWNVPDRHGDTPIMTAVKEDKTEIADILFKCPRVDLNCCRFKEGWSLVFKDIQNKKRVDHFGGSTYKVYLVQYSSDEDSEDEWN